eukprot:364365-Chlamydomonas_euryale.AAC.17
MAAASATAPAGFCHGHRVCFAMVTAARFCCASEACLRDASDLQTVVAATPASLCCMHSACTQTDVLHAHRRTFCMHTVGRSACTQTDCRSSSAASPSTPPPAAPYERTWTGT